MGHTKLTAKAPLGLHRAAMRSTHWPMTLYRPSSVSVQVAAPCGYSEAGADVFLKRFAQSPEHVSCPLCRGIAEVMGPRHPRILAMLDGGGLADLSACVKGGNARHLDAEGEHRRITESAMLPPDARTGRLF